MIHAFICSPFSPCNGVFLQRYSLFTTPLSICPTAIVNEAKYRQSYQHRQYVTINHSANHLRTLMTTPSSSSSSSSSSLSLNRRNFLSHLLCTFTLLFLHDVQCAHAVNGKEGQLSILEVASMLSPLVNLYDSLDELEKDIEAGTNADVRRVVRTLQKGIDVNQVLKPLLKSVPSSSDANSLRQHAREAIEYLNQVVDYFDSTQLKERPPQEMLNFSLQAVAKARMELDLALNVFPDEVITEARRLVTSN